MGTRRRNSMTTLVKFFCDVESTIHLVLTHMEEMKPKGCVENQGTSLAYEASSSF